MGVLGAWGGSREDPRWTNFEVTKKRSFNYFVLKGQERSAHISAPRFFTFFIYIFCSYRCTSYFLKFLFNVFFGVVIFCCVKGGPQVVRPRRRSSKAIAPWSPCWATCWALECHRSNEGNRSFACCRFGNERVFDVFCVGCTVNSPDKSRGELEEDRGIM